MRGSTTSTVSMCNSKYIDKEPLRSLIGLDPITRKDLRAYDINAWQVGSLELRFQELKTDKEKKKT